MLRSHRYSLLTRAAFYGWLTISVGVLKAGTPNAANPSVSRVTAYHLALRSVRVRARGCLALACLSLLIACGGPAPATTGASSSSEQSPQGAVELVRVVRVVDGDTIEVLRQGQRNRVRYIGINTPESVAPDRPVECFGKEAAERNKALLEGRDVRLERDVSETDRFGRLLRYVWMNDVLINALLVEEGFAEVSTFPPDVRYQSLFTSLQQAARQQGRGFWTACPTRREHT
jgi:micrococcal nuclease